MGKLLLPKGFLVLSNFPICRFLNVRTLYLLQKLFRLLVAVPESCLTRVCHLWASKFLQK